MEIFVAFLALLFTVGSFYYMNWRRSDLKLSRPRPIWMFFGRTVETGGLIHKNKLLIAMPLVLWNAGALPALVVKMRAVLHEKGRDPVVLRWDSSFKGNFGLEDAHEKWAAAPFALSANQTQQQGFVFHINDHYGSPVGNISLSIEFSPDGENWQKLDEFPIPITNDEHLLLGANQICLLSQSL